MPTIAELPPVLDPDDARRVGGPATRELVVATPTVWGTARCTDLYRSLATARRRVVLVPRAVAVARSHTDPLTTACAVVEPFGACPRRGPLWAVHRMVRGTAGWELGSTRIRALRKPDWPAGDLDDLGAIFVDEAVVDSVETDSTETDDDSVVRWLHRRTAVGRILRVDADLLRRYGADPGVADHQRSVVSDTPSPTRSARPGRRRLLAAATVAAVAVVVAVLGTRTTSVAPSPQSVTVGRVQFTVPADWRRTELSAEPNSPARSVFVHRDDGRRIIVVQTALRRGSTPQTVARSLANKVAQRGDGVVAEFAPSMRVGRREVIAYRETPASGASISWYVLVEQELQVSIGCQAGDAAVSVQPDCVVAVSSAVIR